MKKRIQFFQCLYTLYISCALLSFGLFYQNPAYAQTLDSFYVEDIKGNLAKLDTMIASKAIIVLYSSSSCTGCKYNLSQFFNKTDLPNNIPLICIIKNGNSILKKREQRLYIESEFLKMKTVYYSLNVHSLATYKDFFKEYNVAQTPTVLLVDKKDNSVVFIKYADLYTDSMELSVRFKLIFDKFAN